MTLKTRRVLYITFILIFILLSSVVVLYSAGYRYHFKKLRFQKSGGILLEFSPKEVDIYIQNKDKKTTGFLDDSYKVTGMLPGEYMVKIEKDGYYSWKKKLTVESEKINFVKNIILFKKDESPKLVTNSNIINIKNLNTKNKFIFVEKEEQGVRVNIFDKKTDEISSILKTTTTSTDNIALMPSSKNKKVLISENKNNHILTISNKEILSLGEEIKEITDVINIHWDKDSDEVLYFIKKNEIYQFNIFNNKLEKLDINNPKNNKIIDFDVINNDIYAIIESRTGLIVEKIGKESGKKTLIIDNIQQKSSFVAGPKPYITILNNDELLVINTENQKIILQDKANHISWSEKLGNNYIIIYNNDFEIFRYDTETTEKTLITRSSNKINDVILHPNNEHVFFSNNNTVSIIELDKYREKTATQIILCDNVNNININDDGKTIYLNGKINEITGLFKIIIE